MDRTLYVPCYCYGEVLKPEYFPWVTVKEEGKIKGGPYDEMEVISLTSMEWIKDDEVLPNFREAAEILSNFLRAECMMTGADDGTCDYFPGAFVAFHYLCRLLDLPVLYRQTELYVRNHNNYYTNEGEPELIPQYGDMWEEVRKDQIVEVEEDE